MPEIHYVTAQITANQVTEGFYALEGGILTMTDQQGNPVHLPDRGIVQQAVGDAAMASAVARVLTKDIRTAFRGETVAGFGRAIDYPESGLA